MTDDCLRFIPLIVRPEVEAGTREMYRVFADFVAQEPPRGAVFVPRHVETACKIAQPRDHYQRDLMLPLPPADAPTS
jgi:hypothetical protein